MIDRESEKIMEIMTYESSPKDVTKITKVISTMTKEENNSFFFSMND